MPTPETKPSSQCCLPCLEQDACKVPSNRNAVSWVKAAVGTNLSKFNLFRTKAKSEILNGGTCHYVFVDKTQKEIKTENPSTQNKQNRVTQTSIMPNSTAKRVSYSKHRLLGVKGKDTDKEDQSKESGSREAASLAEKLHIASHEWFLKYLEDSLNYGFGLRREEGSAEVACLLGQLKKVNHWLDNLVGGGDKVDHRIENLKKRFYGFLLEHVNSAVASSK